MQCGGLSRGGEDYVCGVDERYGVGRCGGSEGLRMMWKAMHVVWGRAGGEKDAENTEYVGVHVSGGGNAGSVVSWTRRADSRACSVERRGECGKQCVFCARLCMKRAETQGMQTTVPVV
ncbi:hypothetical protein E2C01_050555 [Portunus trituberculatus]|uniref:Uncharacterized protein n=1 Tax=Portunus trituberculatus TaxID=210409 RepID=A0A5B7G9B0_PORTR|nr:hypothetical protein [Portunus trituberculatus]